MHALWHDLPPEMQGGWAPVSREIEATVLAAIRPGDAIMVKGSNGSRMAPIVAALEKRYSVATSRHEDL